MRAAVTAEAIVLHSFLSFVILFGLIPYLLPATMPTWRWWLAATLVGGGLLSALWIQEWIVSSRFDFKGGPGYVIGLLIWLIVTIGFVSGVAVRALTLVLAWKGIRLAHQVAITIAGFGIMLATLILIQR
jgi:hypothetical protein